MIHPFILAAEALELEASKKPKYAHAALLMANHLRNEAIRLPEVKKEDNYERS